jgi:putative nucleotidyltransferase with HDIG domain
MPVHAEFVYPPSPSAERPWAIKRLPPFPAVALQLLRLLDDEDVTMRQIVNLLRVDPALSAEILRVSNSALYGLSRRIDNVSHAVVVLGTEVVKRLALTVAIGKFTRTTARGATIKRCWDHSVAVALLSEKLALGLRQPRDRGYTAGLLHDIGALALLTCYPVEYGNMLEVARDHELDQLECERSMFDIDHAAAGEWLARQWNLPDDLVRAVGLHHSEAAIGNDIPSIVRYADRFADALGFGMIDRPFDLTPAEITAELPIEVRASFLEGLDETAGEIEAAIQAFA